MGKQRLAARFLSVVLLLGMHAQAEAVDYQQVRQKIFQVYCLDCHSQPGAAAGLDLSTYAEVLASGIIVVGDADQSLLYQKLEMGEMPRGGDPLAQDELDLVRKWIEDGAKDAPPAAVVNVKSATPRFGPTTGGTVIELEGENLDSVTEIEIAGKPCANLKVVSAAKLSCETPAQNNPGMVSATVRTATDSFLFDNLFEYRLPLAPTYAALLVNVLKPRCLRCHAGENPAKGLDLSSYAAALSHRRAVIPGDLKRSRIHKRTASGEMPRGGPRLTKVEVQTIRD